MVQKWFWAFPNDLPKKWSKNGLGIFWAFPKMTCPKSGQKVSKKWSKNGLSKIWGQKTAQKVVNKFQKIVFGK